MDPVDFEDLVADLFRAMDMDVMTTARTGDGGVDIRAVDRDPIRGGRLIIQVKRYQHTIPPAPVRDLYGTLLHEGATKGILVTTARFGPSAVGRPLLRAGRCLACVVVPRVATMCAMQVVARPPTPFAVSGRVVPIATERWMLEPWLGDDPPQLAKIWSSKPKFCVDGARSCAELAIVGRWVREGWGAVWVSAFAGELRTAWFPAAGFRTISDAGAPDWAAETFRRLRAANGGRLAGFFDVFAWRKPGEVRFAEAKGTGDRIRPTQRQFLSTALRFHDASQFTVIEVRPLNHS
jgi:hypothetical protein